MKTTPKKIKYSVLDLAPICEGATARDAFANSVSLAKHAESFNIDKQFKKAKFP